MTKTPLPNLATELLSAVAEGHAESFELARRLAEAVLAVPLVRQAAVLRDLLKERSPFALVRAVALAELVLESAEPVASKGVPGG